jgi:hypothetical protein
MISSCKNALPVEQKGGGDEEKKRKKTLKNCEPFHSM